MNTNEKEDLLQNKKDDAIQKVTMGLNVFKWIITFWNDFILMHYASHERCNKFITYILKEKDEKVFSIFQYGTIHYLFNSFGAMLCEILILH